METVYEDPRFIALNKSEHSILNLTFNIKLTIKTTITCFFYKHFVYKINEQ